MTILGDILSNEIELLKRTGYANSIELKIYQAIVSAHLEIDAKLTILTGLINQVVNQFPPDDLVPVSARVVRPLTFTLDGKEIFMPQTIMNDVITAFEVTFSNLAGQTVPPPGGGAVTVSLVDSNGAPSALGSVVVGWPDGSHTDGSGFSVTPASPIGSAVGDASVKYDDTSSNSGTPNDISFTLDLTFANDPNAVSAAVNVSTIKTFPYPTGATGGTGGTGATGGTAPAPTGATGP
jgi:hypothetical protein